jgi:hypothetical protein
MLKAQLRCFISYLVEIDLLLAYGGGMKGDKKQNTREDELIRSFWEWFIDNELGLYEAGDVQTEMMIELIMRLKKIDSMLLVDFGLEEEGKRELVVTAQGDRSKFGLVMKVVEMAPKLKKWKVRAFRKRRPLHMAIVYQGVRVKTSDGFFSYSMDKNKMRVRVYFLDWLELRGMERQIAMTMAENLLGEYDAATWVIVEIGGRVKDKGEGEELKSILELPRVFDERVKKN